MSNTGEKIRASIDIFGKSYKVIGTLTQKYVTQLCQLINDKMYTIARSSPRLDAEHVYVLTLVQLTDELTQKRTSLVDSEAQRAQMRDQIDELRKTVDDAEEKVRVQAKEIHMLLDRMNTLEEEYAQRQRVPIVPSAQEVQQQELKTNYARLQEDYVRLKQDFEEWLQMLEEDKSVAG